VIIANITKNILLGSTLYIDLYSKPGTILLLSGFYIEDISDILDGFKAIGFQQEKQSSMDNWACLRLVKN
jgi:ribosomal protein L11 methyltransferase